MVDTNHRDSETDDVTEEIKKYAVNHERRFLQDENMGTLCILHNSDVLLHLKKNKDF